jgi:hypothetical protein
MASRSVEEGLDSWEVLVRLLPEGWEAGARESGALKRLRGFSDANVLLRTLMLHLALGCSLRETAVRARVAGWAEVSDVAVLKRLRGSEEWFRQMAISLLKRNEGRLPQAARGFNIRMTDATTVNEPGNTGTDWRLHFAMSLVDLRCDFFELTDVEGGETLRRVPVKKNDLIVGDRGYANAPGVAHVIGQGGHVLVRMTTSHLPLSSPNGKPFRLLEKLRKLPKALPKEWPVRCATPGGGWIAGRVCAIRKSAEAARKAERKLKRRASKKQQTLKATTLESSRYVFVFTTVPAMAFSTQEVLSLYRARWQVELAFKRLKSLVGFGTLPKSDPASCRAWLYGKLLVGLLAEALAYQASAFSPWGYPLATENAGDRVA